MGGVFRVCLFVCLLYSLSSAVSCVYFVFRGWCFLCMASNLLLSYVWCFHCKVIYFMYLACVVSSVHGNLFVGFILGSISHIRHLLCMICDS